MAVAAIPALKRIGACEVARLSVTFQPPRGVDFVSEMSVSEALLLKAFEGRTINFDNGAVKINSAHLQLKTTCSGPNRFTSLAMRVELGDL